MVAGEEEKPEYVKQDRQRVREMDYHVQFLRDKLCRLESELLKKEKCINEKNTEVTLEDEKGATHTIPINQSVRSEEALHKQIYEVDYCADDYIQQVDDFEQKLLSEEDFSKNDYYEDARKKLSILELYRNLQILEENRKYFHDAPQYLGPGFQNKVGMKCQMKNHSCYGHCPHKQVKKEFQCGHACNNARKYNSFTSCCCHDDHVHNSGFNSNRSKLNVSPEPTYNHIPLKKSSCSCHQMSQSSEDSDESFDTCFHMPEEEFEETSSYNGKEEEVESQSSSEDETTCSEVSKCTCYCSKNHSHDESSEAESDRDVYDKKTKTERFRGGLDVANPKTRALIKYDKKNLKEEQNDSKDAKAVVDKLKFLKVEELREGLERLKIRNRNLRDFLDTLQNPIDLMEKPSETNTICTRVSSCYTFDAARQTRSGLLTVVEVLKGKCRNKDAMIIALADELKTGNESKINIQDIEKDKILKHDKSLVWNGLIEEKNSRRKFTKKDSAIGFAVFLMILISHVKRSEMISYFSAAKKILTESPFKLGLFINEAENISIDFISSYYQHFTNSFQNFMKYSFERWLSIAVQFSQWFDFYFAHFKQHLDDVNNFVITNQSYILPIFCAILFTLFVMNYKKIRANINLISIPKYEKIYSRTKSTIVKIKKVMKKFCLKLVSSRIFWFTLGFCTQILWNLIHNDSYKLLDSFKMYYAKNAENFLFKHVNNTQEMIDNDCTLFDKFDYSWLTSMFCNKFQSFVQFAYYIIKNV